MEAVAIGNYGSLVIPVVVGLVLLFVVIKVVNAIIKLILLVVLIAIIGGGYMLFARINSMETAAKTAIDRNLHGVTSVSALQHSVSTAVKREAQRLGLDPKYLQVKIICNASGHAVHMQYTDQKFLFGALNKQDFTVALPSGVRC